VEPSWYSDLDLDRARLDGTVADLLFRYK